MDEEQELDTTSAEEPQHLKRVSRIKHKILEKYLPSWAIILGSRNSQLAYVDCFAGPGEYEMDGKPVEGSPAIAVREAKRLIESGHVRSLLVNLLDDKPNQVETMKANLKKLQPYPRNLTVEVNCADCRTFVPALLQRLPLDLPTFFLIDPYGHPLPVPVIAKINRRSRTEVLVNLMWFQMNRDLNNPKVETRLNELFGDNDWQNQAFMRLHGPEREKKFLAYFTSRLGATYVLPFRIRYDVEDIHGGRRTKYYLLHVSNHVKAVLLMKEVMWPLGDEEGTFDFSGESQGVLISRTPTLPELESILLAEFRHTDVGFDELRERTWRLPFIEKHYREAVRRLLESEQVSIQRITSRRKGIGGKDRIRFK